MGYNPWKSTPVVAEPEEVTRKQEAVSANGGHFKISKMKRLAGSINAEMFAGVNEEAPIIEHRSVAAGTNGLELVQAVANYKFIMSFKDKGADGTGPVSVMTRGNFIPLGIAADGDADWEETLYVMIGAQNADQPEPVFVPNEIYQQMTSVLTAVDLPELRKALPVRLVTVNSSVVNRVVNFLFYRAELKQSVLDEEDDGRVHPLSVDLQPGETGVIMQARLWFQEALNREASDIHIEPMDNGVGRIRLRVDGELIVLQDRIPVPDLTQIVTWIKAQSRMDISERRKPLDGGVRISYTDAGTERLVDVRVSTIPTVFGQKMVMRLLDPDSFRKRSVKGLGGTIWDPTMRHKFTEALESRDGIVLVTGPTGSGKTSTLNVALSHLLNEVYHDTMNVATVEDPVEYTIPGANQTQINEAAGVTFAKMLRALLRQDPDIILVGEIRDPETAQIAVQAALTGHLILATLHTNDALGAVDRLKDLGISPFLIGSTVRMMQAQRLIQTLCKNCGHEVRIEGEDLVRKVRGSRISEFEKRILAEGGTVYGRSEQGCPFCDQRGYKGRIAVMEMVAPSAELIRTIESGAGSRELMDVATSTSGYLPMLENGVDMLRAGITTISELETLSLAAAADDEPMEG